MLDDSLTKAQANFEKRIYSSWVQSSLAFKEVQFCHRLLLLAPILSHTDYQWIIF